MPERSNSKRITMFGGAARLIVALRLVRRQGQNWTREVRDHPANVLEILRASGDSEIGLKSTLGRLGAAYFKLVCTSGGG
jgi:hypothetical protein